MKNRVISMVLAIIIVLAIAIIASFSANTGMSNGYFLNTNGGAMLVKRDGAPISLTSTNKDDFYDFAGIKDGEKIFVFHDGINETYPASTGVYFVIPLGGASPDNIPRTTIISLTELGWLDREE